ncbi:MAG: NAD(P)H-dependent oxidoreductase subunit E [Myxococcota bacterium]
MDLHPIKTQPSAKERALIDAVLGAPAFDGTELPRGVEPPVGLGAAKSRRQLLLPTLHAVQRRFGYVSEGALGYLSQRLLVPPAEAYGVASFYALFSLEPAPKTVLHVCDDIACKIAGAEALLAGLEKDFAPHGQERQNACFHRSPCLGLCEQAPAALLLKADEHPVSRGFGGVSLKTALDALQKGRTPEPEAATIHQDRAGLRLLRRVGVVDPLSLDDYRAHGGYQALRRAFELGPSGVIREVVDSKLVGRGGAAFPTGKKWAAVAQQPVRPHWLIMNADESEPGTFKDRVLMEDDPFALIEAMTIAAYAISAERGIIYLRGEYPLAEERLAHAIREATSRGFLGQNVMGKAFDFSLSIFRGAGAYICGEETALMNSIEGFRGEPRSKPPFPVEIGLFGKPTVINNVETLANIPDIVLWGGAAFAAIGTPDATGTRLFCLSGHLERPGIYEVPFGTTLRALIALGGGVKGGRAIRAILLGGAAGTFVGPDQLDLVLDFASTRKAQATLGSGVVMIFDDSTEILEILRRIAEFFRDESCGQCVPCRVGTMRMEELLSRAVRKSPLGTPADERALLDELSLAMRDASICGLGQTATSAIDSAVSKLRVLGGP